jgi:hypothetical protein
VLSGALVAGTVGAIALVGGLGSDRPQNETPAVASGPELTEPDQDLSEAPPVESTQVATTSVPASTQVTEPAVPVTTVSDDLTVAQVRTAQLAALRSLQGFAATVSRTVVAPDGTSSVQESRFSLLADGSFYNETGPGLFQSYDASTGTVLAAFDNGSGGISYQRIIGQQDNSLPLLMLAGYDPTIVVQEDSMSDQVAEVVEYDGATAWQVTSTFEFKKTPDFVSEGGPPPDDFTQITTQTIDPTTGLVVAYTVTSTRESQQTIDSHLVDVEAIDTMPAGFPGTVPEGSPVDESGSPTGFQAATANDVASSYGIPTPIPASAGTATITISESLTYDDGADSRIAEPAGTYRQTTFTTMEGFVKTAVMLFTQSLDEGHEPPDGMASADGYLCFDLDGNNQCELPELPPGDDTNPNLFRITEGALAGQLAEFGGQSLSTQLPPFRISIQVDNLDDAKAIANSFNLVSPA